MPSQHQSDDFSRRVDAVKDHLARRLQVFRPGPRTYITAFCVGTVIGEFAAQAGGAQPGAVTSAVAQLGSQLGVNLLADIVGERGSPPASSPEEIAEVVQHRLEQGHELPAVRALLSEFGVIRLALNEWSESQDERLQRLMNEIAQHPQLIAETVADSVASRLDPRLTRIEGGLDAVLTALRHQHGALSISLQSANLSTPEPDRASNNAKKFEAALDACLIWDRKLLNFVAYLRRITQPYKQDVALKSTISEILKKIV